MESQNHQKPVCYTVGDVLEITSDQCFRRGLKDCSLWLSELALSASEGVLLTEMPLWKTDCSKRSVGRELWQATLTCDDSLVGPHRGGGGGHNTRRAKYYLQVAQSLLTKQEYQRCYFILSTAVREWDEISSSSSSALQAEVNDTKTVLREMLIDDISLAVNCFATTTLPSALQFMCCYALYLSGQKIKQTSSNPHRSYNPHLRVVQSMLVEALKNPVNTTCPADPTGGKEKRNEATPANKRRREEEEGASDLLVYKDPYLCWLLGVVLKDMGLKQEAAGYWIAAVRRQPFFWSAWEDLSTLVTREAQLAEMEELLADDEEGEGEGEEGCGVSARSDIMLQIFLGQLRMSLGVVPSVSAGVASDLLNRYHHNPTVETTATTNTNTNVNNSTSNNSNSMNSNSHSNNTNFDTVWEVLLKLFPKSNYILSQLAGYHYHQRKDLPLAEQLYATVHRRDPQWLECTPDYSNVLFMQSNQVQLGNLAQQVYHIDPFRAESNFVVGNYYVFLGQHERSVIHFRRATAVDPTFVAAWTLLGHAYVETKNSSAAVEAYRTVVEVDQRDYRGWYNLGQIHELLQAHHHALYYYWHTTSLRPADPRMWAAVANCLEHDGRLAESVSCLERAEQFDSPNSETYPAITRRIAHYYIDRRSFGRACVYLSKLVQARTTTEEDRYFALPFLVQHHLLQGQQTAELPARSPSYDPQREEGEEGWRTGSEGRLSDPRLAQALHHIDTAKRYLEMLVKLVGDDSDSGEGEERMKENTEETGGGGVGAATKLSRSSEVEHRMTQFIKQMRLDIRVNEQAIRQKI